MTKKTTHEARGRGSFARTCAVALLALGAATPLARAQTEEPTRKVSRAYGGMSLLYGPFAVLTDGGRIVRQLKLPPDQGQCDNLSEPANVGEYIREHGTPAEGYYYASLGRPEPGTIAPLEHTIRARLFACEADARREVALRWSWYRRELRRAPGTLRAPSGSYASDWPLAVDLETRALAAPGFDEVRGFEAVFSMVLRGHRGRRCNRLRRDWGSYQYWETISTLRHVTRRAVRVVARKGRVVVWLEDNGPDRASVEDLFSEQPRWIELGRRDRTDPISYLYADAATIAASDRQTHAAVAQSREAVYRRLLARLAPDLLDVAERALAEQPAVDAAWRAWQKRVAGGPVDELPLSALVALVAEPPPTEKRAAHWRRDVAGSERWARAVIERNPDARLPRRILALTDAAAARGPVACERRRDGVRSQLRPARKIEDRVQKALVGGLAESFIEARVFARIAKLLDEGAALTQAERDALLAALLGEGDHLPEDGWRVVERLGIYPAVRAWHRITVEATPSSLPVDGKSEARITVRILEERGDGNAATPVPKAPITFHILAEGGASPGQITDRRARTDAVGQATTVFRSPKAKEIRDEGITSVTVLARCDTLGLEEEVHLQLEGESGQVEVRPTYGAGLWSRKGVIPADPHFPATISIRLTRGEKDQADEDVTFEVVPPVRGELEALAPGGARGPSVKTRAGADGVARVRYRYTGPSALPAPLLQAIRIQAKGMTRTEYAFVSVGVDLALASVRSGYEGKGPLSAGERVPIRVVLRDRFHPAVTDLTPLLRAFGSNEEAPRLTLTLDAVPTGYTPRYLLEHLQIATSGNAPRHTPVDGIFDRKRGQTVLRVPGAGWPTLRPRYPGGNLYEVRVSLGAEGPGAPPPERLDPTPGPERGVVCLRTGVAADAIDLFFTDDPFGPNTPEAKVFRTVLDLMGYGVLLKPTEVLTRLNRGDLAGVLASLVGLAHGKLSGALGKTLPAELADAYATLSVAEQVVVLADQVRRLGGAASGRPELQTGADLQVQALTRRILDASSLEGKKLVTVTGAGEQALLGGKDGARLVAKEGALLELPGGGGWSVRRGGVSVYLVPEDLRVRATGGEAVTAKPR